LIKSNLSLHAKDLDCAAEMLLTPNNWEFKREGWNW